MNLARLPFVTIGMCLAALASAIAWGPSLIDPRGAPVAGEKEGHTIILNGSALHSPDPSPEQVASVTAHSALRIEVLPNQPPPTPAERGVRILLTPERAHFIKDKQVLVEVSYQPSQAFWNSTTPMASGLAVSLQGIGPAEWRVASVVEQVGVASFELLAELEVNAIGIRAISEVDDQGGSLEITEIRLTRR